MPIVTRSNVLIVLLEYIDLSFLSDNINKYLSGATLGQILPASYLVHALYHSVLLYSILSVAIVAN